MNTLHSDGSIPASGARGIKGGKEEEILSKVKLISACFSFSAFPYYIQLSSITQVFSFISSPHSNTLFSQEVLSLTHCDAAQGRRWHTIAILFLFIVFSFWYYCSFYTYFLILWSYCLQWKNHFTLLFSNWCFIVALRQLMWLYWLISKHILTIVLLQS